MSIIKNNKIDELILKDFFERFLEKSSTLNDWLKFKSLLGICDSYQEVRKKVEKSYKKELFDRLSEVSKYNQYFHRGDIFYQWALTLGDCSDQSISMPPYLTIDYSPKVSHSMETYRELIQLVLELGIGINGKNNSFEQTPLCTAIGFDNQPFALALLTFPQVDLNASCCDLHLASTPLLLAIQRGNTTVAAELIRLGADVNKADRLGMTPLHWAMIMGDNETMALLLAKEDIVIKRAKNNKYPIDYLKISPTDLEPISKEGFDLTTKKPEFFQVDSHFWHDHQLFLDFRASRAKNIEACASLLLRSKYWGICLMEEAAPRMKRL